MNQSSTATIAEQGLASLIKTRELSAQRLLMAYAITGMSFMLLPGTFLGVWNLISISGGRGGAVSTAWIQAHGHAQIFGWIGTFILGIGFYSIPKLIPKSAGRSMQPATLGGIAWLFWTVGVLLRWISGFYHFSWRTLLPISALLELCAFLIFLGVVRNHRPADSNKAHERMPIWIVSVLIGTIGFGASLLLNLAVAAYVSLYNTGPAFPVIFEARFLVVVGYGFIVPMIWGFSARWLPVFLGLKPLNERALGFALFLNISGVLLAAAGFLQLAHWIIWAAAVTAVIAFNLFELPNQAPKTTGVHVSFPAFVRIAYIWLPVATTLGICGVYLDQAHGWIGASRHALTVGFVSTMVFAIGQRVLPAFAGMRLLFSTRLMLTCLLLLNVGCALRVSSEILAYENYWSPAWKALPWSAICELAAVTVFAANMLLTFIQRPAHLRAQET
jgi:uncharacterized protein involved in response to NO